MASVLQAAKLIDQEGIPKNHVWSQYYFIVDNKEYPFKYLAYRALQLAGADVKFESNDSYRNYFKDVLGLQMNHYPGGYNFFTKEELDYFTSIVQKPYRKSDTAHQTYPNKLNALIAKVNFWAEAIQMNGYKLRKDRNWLTGWTANIKPYIWPRVYKDNDQDIFFNVEVNAKDRFVGYKLDGYYETTKKLKPEQIEILDDFKREIGWQWVKISFEEIDNYSWERLISETKAYILEYDVHYDHLKKRLYKQMKLARMTWNTNGWQKPSGRLGKAPTKSYENDNGFGHEEWLFDADKVIGDYKYGFLEPINKSRHLYEGKVYDISLFTRNALDKTYYWITTLKNVEVLTGKESQAIQQEYEDRDWFDEMKNDLEEIGLKGKLLNKWVESDRTALFNVKFLSRQLNSLPSLLLPVDDEKDIAADHYVLYDVNAATVEKYEKAIKTPFSFGSGSTEADLKAKGKRKSFTIERELEFKHNELQRKLLIYLQNLYTKSMVKRECKAFGGCRIDIVRQTDTGYVFYEIKTYNNLLTSIRLGIGQLLEYNLFPKSQQSEHMVLVSHQPATREVKDYILHLKSFINLKFTYMHFDIEQGCVVSEI